MMETMPVTGGREENRNGVQHSGSLGDLIALGQVRRPWWETRIGRTCLGLVPFAAAAAVWLFLSAHRPQGWQFAVPLFVPTMKSVYADLFTTHEAWSGAAITLSEAGLGLLIAGVAGIVVGVVIRLVHALDVMVYPVVVYLQAIPKVALAPILILVFGFGVQSKIALAAAVAFFPVLANTSEGMRQVRHDEIDLLRSLQASSWQLFFKVRLPRALPSIFAGLQVGFVFALLGAVVGEYLGGTSGLGSEIAVRSSRLDVSGVFSGIIEIAVLGVSLTLLLNAASRLLSNWQES